MPIFDLPENCMSLSLTLFGYGVALLYEIRSYLGNKKGRCPEYRHSLANILLTIESNSARVINVLSNFDNLHQPEHILGTTAGLLSFKNGDRRP